MQKRYMKLRNFHFMIKITTYIDERKVLVKFLEDLQDHIIEIDPLKRFVRLPAYGEKYADELIEQVGKQNGVIYFAKDENIRIGMIIGIVEELTEKDLLECVPSKIGTILQLFVKDEYRDKKIGSLLIDKMEEYFHLQECDVIYVGILEPNKIAHDFYQKRGYQDRIINLMKKIS